MSKVAAANLKYNQCNNHIILGKISFPVWFIFCSMLCQFLCVSLSFQKRRLMTTFYLLICPTIVQILSRFSPCYYRVKISGHTPVRKYPLHGGSVVLIESSGLMFSLLSLLALQLYLQLIVWLFFRCSFVTLSVVLFFIFFFRTEP